MTHATGPLAGVKIVDMSTVVLGPFATLILADLGAEVIPGQTALVTLFADRELNVHEINDGTRRYRPQVLTAVRDPRGNPHEPRVAVPEDDPHHLTFGLRALAHIGEDQEDLVARRHVPDICLPVVQVEGLDRIRLKDGVVHLLRLEALDALVHAAVEATELRHRSAIVIEALELDELDSLDALSGRVVLEGEVLSGG